MTLVPDAPWYRALLVAVQDQQRGVSDRVGRPWAQHFERVALRTLFRNPAAPRAQLEAALLHDAFMDRGGGGTMLASLDVCPEAVEMIRITTPPADADYYRDFEAIGPTECTRYLDYITTLAASGHHLAIQMKLADITDTIDACRTGATPILIDQYRTRYEPSRRILEAALGPLV